jgi:hypothetical protein
MSDQSDDYVAQARTLKADLYAMQTRYEEAVQTILTVRESVAARDQKNAALERELRAAALQLSEANARIERAVLAADEVKAQLAQRDNRIAVLEQQCADSANALSAMNQRIERANQSKRLAGIGFALEALDQIGQTHRIHRTTTTVGRAITNDIAIDSSSVSRYHARLLVQPQGVWLIDLQSTNGCTVNGRRIHRQILCDGDAVTIGHCKFRFSTLGVAPQDPAFETPLPLLDDPVLLSRARQSSQESLHDQRH